MSLSNPTLVAEAKKELLQLEQRMEALRTLILAYDDTPPAASNAGAVSKANAGQSPRKRGRAPVGAFRVAALKVFDKGTELTARKVRDAMLADGYKYVLSSNHLSRELAKLVESGEITSKPNGAYTTYRKAKAKKNA